MERITWDAGAAPVGVASEQSLILADIPIDAAVVLLSVSTQTYVSCEVVQWQSRAADRARLIRKAVILKELLGRGIEPGCRYLVERKWQASCGLAWRAGWSTVDPAGG